MKYLLCRPRGGFNDTLCQIFLCLRYAKKYNRKIIIDTTKSGLHDSFSNYFKFKYDSEYKDYIYDSLEDVTAILNNKTTFPSFIQGKIDSYKIVIIPNIGFAESISKNKVTFNFNLDYSEDLLVHEGPGGGPYSIDTLINLDLQNNVEDLITERLKDLKLKNYYSIHIRNTDTKTDYIDFIENIRSLFLNEKILVCSDDEFTKNRAMEMIGLNSFSSSKYENNNGTLHGKKHIDQFYININMLVDLYAMALSKYVFISPSSRSIWHISGFSRLAFTMSAKKVGIPQRFLKDLSEKII